MSISLYPPVAKKGMGNPFYKASNGGFLEGYDRNGGIHVK